MISCPNCRGDTTTRTLSAYGAARPMPVEACAPCNLFWFDHAGSVSPTPEAVIDLFTYIAGVVDKGPRTTLASTFACAHCRAPIALIDPEGVAKTLRDLDAEKAAKAPPDPEAMRTVLAEAQADAILARERMREDERQSDIGHDLLAIGVGAIGTWLAARLAAG